MAVVYNVQKYVTQLACDAKEASRPLGFASNKTRVNAVLAMASALREHAPKILAANAQDMKAAERAGTSESLLDRLLLTQERIEGMAQGLEVLAKLPDPVGRVLQHRTIDCGLDLKKVSVPLGVVAVVYEARPNVTADAAGICIRTGNACILRGGSLAQRSCVAIANVLADAVFSTSLPRAAISIIETTDREALGYLMDQRGVVDVLIPRGGAGLIQRCVRESLVPVIETGTGNCHIYVHTSANLDKAQSIVMNAKTQRVGVCNAAESLLVDNAIAPDFLPSMLENLARAGVLVHGDAATRGAAVSASAGRKSDPASPLAHFVPATEADWGREYLDYEISVKVVSGIDEAIAHINRYGTEHSEAIIAEDKHACKRFFREIDAAAVYANASTRFTDGGEFGLGAEIGISTQKLHARGPFAAEALTTYKYVVQGEGQVRP